MARSAPERAGVMACVPRMSPLRHSVSAPARPGCDCAHTPQSIRRQGGRPRRAGPFDTPAHVVSSSGRPVDACPFAQAQCATTEARATGPVGRRQSGRGRGPTGRGPTRPPLPCAAFLAEPSMPYTPILATLGYVLSPDRRRVLMVHRNARPGDHHLGKYNGLGGKLEPGEDVVAGMRREIREEAGIECDAMQLRGTISWPGFGRGGEDWFGFVFLVTGFSGEPFASNPEGSLEWV